MNRESTRTFLLSLPHVVETLQWGDNLVFWIGDKTLGGKMFALLSLTPVPQPTPSDALLSFPTHPERFAELAETDGLRPAPYFARIGWIALDRWSALATPDLQALLTEAHARTLAKLPRRTRVALGLLPPPAPRKSAKKP